MPKKDEVVRCCPIRGHMPLCTNEECSKERDSNFIYCNKSLGINVIDICRTTNLECIKCNPGPCEHRV